MTEFHSSKSHTPVSAVLRNVVKLVIWDLDETFWNGTLSEEGITPIVEHIELVKILAHRGIVSSICSKNDFETARRELQRLGIWDYFVFPAIGWTTKGPMIRDLIQRANLRPENVLFIDDNPANREGAIFHSPGLMCLASPRMLVEQLSDRMLLGNDDPGLSRLKQYQLLEKKTQAKENVLLSGIDFLRQSEICVEINYDVERHLDRVIELINRANQLNFTKLRLHDSADRSRFEEMLNEFGVIAGTVSVSDRYGDYGLVGFFVIRRDMHGKRLEHFVFSCRILNMGVEQYVYERLGCPSLAVQDPVANPVQSFAQVDWISDGPAASPLPGPSQQRCLLLGGCDLYQLAAFVPAACIEYFNHPVDEFIVRYDDPNFILSDPTRIEASATLGRIPSWTADEMRRFRGDLRDADIVILSLYQGLSDTYFQFDTDLRIRLPIVTLTNLLRSDRGVWFVRNFDHVKLTVSDRIGLIAESVKAVAQQAKADATIFVLTELECGLDNQPAELRKRKEYNLVMQSVCRSLSNAVCLDINRIVREDWIVDPSHLSRVGYHEVAGEIVRNLQARRPVDVASIATEANYYPFQVAEDWQSIRFVDLPLQRFDQPSFHDTSCLADDPLLGQATVDDLYEGLQHDGLRARPMPVIFHTAFCGSTLLARYLQSLRVARFYREPFVFTQLASQKWLEFTQVTQEEWHRVFVISCLLAGRSFPDGLATGLKLHDAANNLADELLDWHPDVRGIVLFSGPRKFIHSCLKQSDRRQWVRTRVGTCGGDRIAELAAVDVSSLSDVQICAYVWLSQMVYCEQTIRRLGSRLCSLNCESLFYEPARTLTAICRFLQTDVEPAAIESAILVHGQRHAKTGAPLDTARQRDELPAGFDEEIEDGLNWLRERCADRGVPEGLPAELAVTG
ncbi:HAD-IIIC family phosphatase [bacterium]|nr:HAD-IIIC family phosphatase [bacterium]